MFRIVDEKGHYVSHRSFLNDKENSRWLYFSETGYLSGRLLYSKDSKELADTVNHLVHINNKLKLNKNFKVVPFDDTDIKIGGNMFCEVVLTEG